MSEKLLKGMFVITIDSRDKICIELRDDTSRTLCVEIECDPVDFANALMHRNAPCEFQLKAEHVGQTMEVKVEHIPFKSSYGLHVYDTRVTAALAPFEVDGWVGNRGDIINFRRRVQANALSGDQINEPQGEFYRVGFHRWVNTP